MIGKEIKAGLKALEKQLPKTWTVGVLYSVQFSGDELDVIFAMIDALQK